MIQVAFDTHFRNRDRRLRSFQADARCGLVYCSFSNCSARRPASSFGALLRGLAFRDSFPLRYACGSPPSSGDEVSFGKTLKPASTVSPYQIASSLSSIASGTSTSTHLFQQYTTVADTLAAKVILPGRRAEPFHRAQARRQCAKITFALWHIA